MDTSDSVGIASDIAIIRRSWKAAAMFYAIAEPEEALRTFQFIDDWRPGVSYGYVDTRQGECVRGALMDTSAIIWGYDEEAPLAASPNKIVDWTLASNSAVPAALREYLATREFDCGGATFCLWRDAEDLDWQVCPLLSGGSSVESHPPVFLDMLRGGAGPFQLWVQEMQEREDLDAIIDAMYKHEPLTREMVGMINKDRDEEEVLQEASSIGYPIAPWR